MKYLIYMSTAKKLLSEKELLDILTVSRQNNEINKLTGVLLYGEGSFVQVLEGDEAVLNTVFEIIEKDDRHKHIIVIASGNQEKRTFSEWTMGFKTVNKAVLSQFAGFKTFDAKDYNASGKLHPALTVLKTFADTNNLV